MAESINHPTAQSILIVAGERSGDVYGAELATALQTRLPEIKIFGCGGEAMRKAGVDTTVDLRDFAMVGIAEVIKDLPRARRTFNLLLEEVDRRKPGLAVLIDSPSLNLRIAKRLKHRKIRIVYFVSPQIWAWKKWRIKHIKARVDKMLCLFDFEEAIYKKAGIPVEFVGNPLLELVYPSLSRQEFFNQAGLDVDTPTVALLPGSREREVFYNLPAMLDAATRLALTRKIQFVIPVAPSLDPQWLESRLQKYYVGRAAVRTVTQATYNALQHSDVAAVASGTATVEAALCERPMVVVYRVSPITFLLGRFMVDVPFYSMVNLLAGKPVVKELIQGDFTAPAVAAQLEYLLDHPEAREEMVKEFRALRPRLGPGGAIQRAADAVIREMQSSQTPVQNS
ncbi:MAG TPA: lipid-A-disaccharide synthase [Terriglobia bacterium]|nr:lipid-A-disaccharide synthase [Terriglobia bacterium]